jgi:hypothetical protein
MMRHNLNARFRRWLKEVIEGASSCHCVHCIDEMVTAKPVVPRRADGGRIGGSGNGSSEANSEAGQRQH